MSHPLSVTIGESKILERAFTAANVTCYIHPDPYDAGRVIFEKLTGSRTAISLRVTLARVGERYTDEYLQFLPAHRPTNGVDALLQVLEWYCRNFFNMHMASIIVAATRAALHAHLLIAYADQREDSIDSGAAIDRCYDAVRVILPEYTTSSDIEPHTQKE